MNLLGTDYFVIPAFGICVFIFSYLMSDKILNWLYDRSLGNREEIIKLMDQMYVDADRKKVTTLLFLASFGLGFVIFLALWPSIVAGLIIGGAVTIIGWSLPKKVLMAMWEKRCTRIVDQMVDGMTIMANGVKAGLSITQSMERVCANMVGPLPQEFNLILNKIRLGMSVEEALTEFGERIPRQDVQMFVTSVNILKETGGNLAETFATIVVTIREDRKSVV